LNKIYRKKILISIGLYLILITPISLILIFTQVTNPGPTVKIVGGTLSEDTTWQGFIHVEDSVIVPENVTLTILPGTFLEFEHYRGYKGGNRKSISSTGGDIVAIGSPEKQIWFTSDAEDPINGDWGGIYCMNTNATIFMYAIIEFAFIGIESGGSRLNISHTIIRWIHAEGVYSSRSTLLIESCLIYDNGYHDLSLEDFNPNITVRFNIFNGGNFAVYSEATNVDIVGNYFVNYTGTAVSGNLYSNLTIIENKFQDVGAQIILDPTTSNITSGNDLLGNGTVPIPYFDYDNPEPRKLGYVPGDPEDRYLYVYPDIDETRQIVRKLENETTFDWSLEYVNGCLWKFEHRSFIKGSSQDFVKINLTTETKEHFGNDLIPNPNGLAYDGEHFWTHDIVLNKIYKFQPNASNLIDIIAVYDIPMGVDSVIGVASDGAFIYFSDAQYIYKLNKTMNLIEKINLVGGSAVGGITWTGTHFWCGEELMLTKWNMNGTIAGQIYPAAEGTIGLTWDGTTLWTSQKTCESWLDAKIFQIDIIDDQVILNQ